MLRIYPVCLEMVRDVRVVADEIAGVDRDLARLRRSSMSVVLNVAEGSGSRDGRRRMRYLDALGSAEETRAGVEAAEAVGHIGELDAALLARLRQIIGTLVKLVRYRRSSNAPASSCIGRSGSRNVLTIRRSGSRNVPRHLTTIRFEERSAAPGLRRRTHGEWEAGCRRMVV